MTAGSVVRFPVFSSGETATDTVSPSAYTRNLTAIARETTVIDRTRERFIVIAMSTLLLLISLTLFFILFTLLSEDCVLQIALDSMHCLCRKRWQFHPKQNGQLIVRGAK
ncbi:uncharacterized protein LOC142761650 isoform X2 [Rhipicephalus microplus]|uniref:uncharacterized protein LOC142761650 isoform X2 n=1 Tax=Rhipicephalus microplus TaxID=6941 RepID=UPI003F6D3D6C